MRLKAKVLVASGGLLLSMAAGAGTASAQDLAPLLNTTCSYSQVIGALTAQNPAAASQLTASPPTVAVVQQYLVSGPAERQQMLSRLQTMPGADQYIGLLLGVAASCNNF
ncbi:hemophore-related protein [Mycobacterium sp. NPDC051804]|uniref:hemophore-related protein n=1 Tax=Mycobacterium sp. NPDC051804 TaxID=3364295 RepID=UPI00379C62B9